MLPLRRASRPPAHPGRFFSTPPATVGACFFRPESCAKCVTTSPPSHPSPFGPGPCSAGRLFWRTTNSLLMADCLRSIERQARPFQCPRVRRRAAHTRPPRLPRPSRPNLIWLAGAHSRQFPPHRARSRKAVLSLQQLRSSHPFEKLRQIQIALLARTDPEMGRPDG